MRRKERAMVKRACTSHNDHRGYSRICFFHLSAIHHIILALQFLYYAYSFLRRFCRSWSKPTCLEKYIKLVVSRPLLKQMIIHFIGSNRARISVVLMSKYHSQDNGKLRSIV
ncbi:uncharacterized protein LOC125208861 isoform X2 [Salvia hispanica]|uniref:uncharacterized protein LOC125208861 isoform X2 n=1 Tax=Salvia hispanica TaxID=49212 RepID=UPI002009042E|nr:uncharacterized protein LOC125208861 isoform X2 [Salvia hispanica]